MATYSLKEKGIYTFGINSNDNSIKWTGGTHCPFDFDISGDCNILQSLKVGSDNTHYIASFGDVVAYLGSDKRFKDNIMVIDNPIDKIFKLSGNTFTWNESAPREDLRGKDDYGVIAQEVKEVLPTAVRKHEDGSLSVEYVKLIPLLIEAIKEQQKQINELKEKM